MSDEKKAESATPAGEDQDEVLADAMRVIAEKVARAHEFEPILSAVAVPYDVLWAIHERYVLASQSSARPQTVAEPMAWLVYVHTPEHEYRVFTERARAEDVADDHGVEALPLYLREAASARPQEGALLERTAQLLAHRGCCGTEHDPTNGKLHGCCVVCGVPWPCEYAGKPPAQDAKVADALAELLAARADFDASRRSFDSMAMQRAQARVNKAWAGAESALAAHRKGSA